MSKLDQITGLIDDLRTVPDATLSRQGCLILADLIEELQQENEVLVESYAKTKEDNQKLYGMLNEISWVIEKGRSKTF
jgi:hypothetical protein